MTDALIEALSGAFYLVTCQRLFERIGQQLAKLRRWHEVTLDREVRILELKAEVNRLLEWLGEPPRYADAEIASGQDKEVIQL